MNLIEQINLLFDNFQDEACYSTSGYDPDWRPNWWDEVETELKLILEHSPIPLPDDYCEIFRRFGGGCIEDHRPNRVMPDMTFWIWDDIAEFNTNVDFFVDCPNALPFGDDMGDVVYFYVNNEIDTGIYMAGKSLTWDNRYWHKIANSFTELFTNTEVQRLFRNYYQYGCDKGTDGRVN